MKAHSGTHAPKAETLLTRQDLSQRHQVSVETLKRREKAGLLPALKLGRSIRYRLSDVLAFEAASEVKKS